ncbi:MAG: Gfo/Idh/MocA family oxidoreductase [Candidatus Poribacteria bacterium]
MSDFEPLKVAIVGCGNISGAYGSSLKTRPDLVQIVGAFDVLTDQAKAFVANYGGQVYKKLEDATF